MIQEKISLLAGLSALTDNAFKQQKRHKLPHVNIILHEFSEIVNVHALCFYESQHKDNMVIPFTQPAKPCNRRDLPYLASQPKPSYEPVEIVAFKGYFLVFNSFKIVCSS